MASGGDGVTIQTTHVRKMLGVSSELALLVSTSPTDSFGRVEVPGELMESGEATLLPVSAVLEFAEMLGEHAAKEMADERLRDTWGFKAVL